MHNMDENQSPDSQRIDEWIVSREDKGQNFISATYEYSLII